MPTLLEYLELYETCQKLILQVSVGEHHEPSSEKKT